MIITRTPLRVSFFGGGTDHPAWFKRHGPGAVLSTSIDKYVYMILRPLPPVFDFNYRVAWRQLEQVATIDEIQNPVVREVLRHYAPDDGVGYEIAYNADLPARSGLGSSSSFTVSALHALFTHLGRDTSKELLAHEAIRVEQELLNEPVGSQDQTAAAYGGLNRIDFHADGGFTVTPADLSPRRKQAFEDHLLMFFTGFTRDAGAIEKTKLKNFDDRRDELTKMYEMVETGLEILEDRNASFVEFGRLLDAGWRNKRALSEGVSNSAIDHVYDAAIKAGAYGGKLLGAGGGGFLLFFAPPERHDAIRAALAAIELQPGKSAVAVDIRLEHAGSEVVLHKPELNRNFQTRPRTAVAAE